MLLRMYAPKTYNLNYAYDQNENFSVPNRIQHWSGYASIYVHHRGTHAVQIVACSVLMWEPAHCGMPAAIYREMRRHATTTFLVLEAETDEQHRRCVAAGYLMDCKRTARRPQDKLFCSHRQVD